MLPFPDIGTLCRMVVALIELLTGLRCLHYVVPWHCPWMSWSRAVDRRYTWLADISASGYRLLSSPLLLANHLDQDNDTT